MTRLPSELVRPAPGLVVLVVVGSGSVGPWMSSQVSEVESDTAAFGRVGSTTGRRVVVGTNCGSPSKAPASSECCNETEGCYSERKQGNRAAFLTLFLGLQVACHREGTNGSSSHWWGGSSAWLAGTGYMLCEEALQVVSEREGYPEGIDQQSERSALS